MRSGPILLAIPLFLTACGPSGFDRGVNSAPPPRPGVSTPPTRPVAPPPPERRSAAYLRAPGLEGVIGADMDALVRQFGSPRLDVREGDARKLQFSGAPCVLDVFLYPTEDYPMPVATYLDARRASDGQDVDRAACVAALRRP